MSSLIVASSNGSRTGGSLTASTLTKKLPESVSSPSVTITLTSISPLKLFGGVKLTTESKTLMSPKDDDTLYVNTSPSTSSADKI